MFLFLNSLLCCSCVIRHLTVRAREPICDASEHHGVEHEHLPRRKMGVERRLLDLRRGYQLLANLVPVLPGTQRKRNPMHLRLLQVYFKVVQRVHTPCGCFTGKKKATIRRFSSLCSFSILLFI